MSKPSYKELEKELVALKKNVIASSQELIYKKFFDNMADMVDVIELIYDKNGQPIDFYIRVINIAFANFFGKTQEQLINKKISSIVDVIEDHWFASFANVDKTGEEIRFKSYGAAYDKFYHVTAWKFSENRVGISMTDITEAEKAKSKLRKNLENEKKVRTKTEGLLKEKRVQLQKTIYNLNSANEELSSQNVLKDKRTNELAAVKVELEQQNSCLNKAAIVSETDADFNITFVNDNFCEIYGYHRAELIGQNHRILKSGKQPDLFFTDMISTIRSGKVFKGKVLNKKKGGQLYWMDITIMPFKDLNGNIIKYVAIMFDINAQTVQKDALLKQADELAVVNTVLAVQNKDKDHRADDLFLANKEKQKRAEELAIANKELAFQNDEKQKRADELAIANTELAFQNSEKQKRADELAIANKELAFQNDEKQKRADELAIANKELAFQNDEKQKRADELAIANKELTFQNDEKQKRADELAIANKELAFQNDEKQKRADELAIANKELAFQNDEKQKRADELAIANKELTFQNDEKQKRADELAIANTELAFQNKEKDNRADELILANKEKGKRADELVLANKEKEKRANELILANKELAFQTELDVYRSEMENVAHDLTLLIDTANAPIFGIDNKGLVNEWNQTSESITGFTKKEVLGKDLVQTYITEDYRESVKKVLYDALLGKETANYEFPLFAKDGQRVMVLLNSSTRRDAKGKITGVLGVGQDISEIDKLRTASESIAKELRQFIETANAPIFGIDSKGLVNEWNQTSESITGFTKDEVLGKDLVQTYITEDYRKSVKKVLDDALLGQETANYEFPLFTKNGQRVMVLLNSSTRRDINGEIIGVLGVGQDITELAGYRNKLELKVNERTLKLNQALEKQKELNELKSRFVSTASHEFRTPLSSINFAAGSIKKYWAKMEPIIIQKKLDKIEDQVLHMTQLLDDILIVGKAEAGKIIQTPLNINLGDFLYEIIDEVSSACEKSHDIELIDTEGLKATNIFIDEKLGRNIFINLIGNAVKYSPNAKNITIALSSEKEYTVVTITDYGIGISKSELKNIFKPFSRGKNVDLIQGTGLGLTIAKDAIDIMGGKIIVKSKNGSGTSFIIKILKN
ncbi:PAS domain S-box protein [Patiriisocius sp. Uisw_047]|uniref:sensor histidine kinase n=1 Tax=Patiriisocius sp. Uisw_047 TaxID=3230969 RepID=UPI0039ED6F63